MLHELSYFILLHVRVIKINFTQLSTELTLEVMTDLETMSKCLFPFHYAVYHNDIVLHSLPKLR